MIVLRTLLGVVVITVIALVNTVIVMWCERKWLGHMQTRQGPRRTGWHGLLQPIADAIKLLGKEDVRPAAADKVLFLVAPLIAFAPSVLMYAAMPWIAEFTGFSFDAGIFMIFAITAIFPVGMLAAGWASHNKYSLIGGFRAAAQQVSYEVPMILAVLGLVMLAESMRLSDIVEAQSALWNIVTQPLAFMVFFIGMLAELNRTPFDVPEAESELVGGFNTEYSSMRFALFFVAEYANVFAWSLICTLLFLGGWGGPVLPGTLWLFLKAYGVVFLIIWVRATFPRVRVDQLMDLGWKLLMPAALVNVVITSIGVTTDSTILMIVLGLAGSIALFFVISWLGEHAGDALRARARGTIGDGAVKDAALPVLTPRSAPTADAEGAGA